MRGLAGWAGPGRDSGPRAREEMSDKNYYVNFHSGVAGSSIGFLVEVDIK